jgi:hypothetical protein
VVSITNASLSDTHRLGALSTNAALFQEWTVRDIETDRRTANEDEEEECLDKVEDVRCQEKSCGSAILASIEEESERDLAALEEDSGNDTRGRASLHMDSRVPQDALLVEATPDATM